MHPGQDRLIKGVPGPLKLHSKKYLRDPGGQALRGLRVLGHYSLRVACNSKLDFALNILDAGELNPWK